MPHSDLHVLPCCPSYHLHSGLIDLRCIEKPMGWDLLWKQHAVHTWSLCKALTAFPQAVPCH